MALPGKNISMKKFVRREHRISKHMRFWYFVVKQRKFGRAWAFATRDFVARNVWM